MSRASRIVRIYLTRATSPLHRGLDAGKTFYRDFKGENEYLIKKSSKKTCQRSWLGTPMPPIELPKMIDIGETEISGKECTHWVRDEGTERIHMWFTKEEGTPMRLTHEHVGEDGVSEPTMTYDIKDFTEGVGDFGLEGVEGDWKHENCERFVGGWPWMHLWHYYWRV